jgi:GDPmannose 4,6-dehydratase
MAGRLTRAIIVGSEGQDGRILFDRLRRDAWEVLGLGRNATRSTRGSANGVDISDYNDVANTVAEWQADAVFYLAAVHRSSDQVSQSSDAALFKQSLQVHVQYLVNFLEALSCTGATGSLFYAASSHVFAASETDLRSEATPFSPDSIYGITKVAGIQACRYYRMHRGVRASTGILYNHESPLRRAEFVSQRIVRAAVEIWRGTRRDLVVGDLQARVDWGYAPDVVDAMVRITQLPDGDDFVVATGETHSVEEFVSIAFACLGLDWRQHVKEDRSRLTRPSETRAGNSARLRARTGWRPSISFEEMVRTLVEHARDRDVC